MTYNLKITNCLLELLQIDPVFHMVSATVNPTLLNTGSEYFWSDVFNAIQRSCEVSCQVSAYGIMLTGSLSQVAKAGEILQHEWNIPNRSESIFYQNFNEHDSHYTEQGTSYQPGTTPCQPPTTPNQPGTTPKQPGTTTPFQLPTTLYQPSTTPKHPATTSFQPPTTPYQTGTTPYQPGTTQYQTGRTPNQPGTTIAYQTCTTTPYKPGTATSYQPGTLHNQPGTTTPHQPGTTPNQPGTTTPYQPNTTTSNQPDTTTPYQPYTTPYQPGTATLFQPGATTPYHSSPTFNQHGMNEPNIEPRFQMNQQDMNYSLQQGYQEPGAMEEGQWWDRTSPRQVHSYLRDHGNAHYEQRPNSEQYNESYANKLKHPLRRPPGFQHDPTKPQQFGNQQNTHPQNFTQPLNVSKTNSDWVDFQRSVDLFGNPEKSHPRFKAPSPCEGETNPHNVEPPRSSDSFQNSQPFGNLENINSPNTAQLPSEQTAYDVQQPVSGVRNRKTPGIRLPPGYLDNFFNVTEREQVSSSDINPLGQPDTISSIDSTRTTQPINDSSDNSKDEHKTLTAEEMFTPGRAALQTMSSNGSTNPKATVNGQQNNPTKDTTGSQSKEQPIFSSETTNHPASTENPENITSSSLAESEISSTSSDQSSSTDTSDSGSELLPQSTKGPEIETTSSNSSGSTANNQPGRDSKKPPLNNQPQHTQQQTMQITTLETLNSEPFSNNPPVHKPSATPSKVTEQKDTIRKKTPIPRPRQNRPICANFLSATVKRNDDVTKKPNEQNEQYAATLESKGYTLDEELD